MEEGGYLTTSTVILGLIAQGRTIAETLEIAKDVTRKIIESSIEHNDLLPKELISKPKQSKQFEIKIPVPLEVCQPHIPKIH